MFSRSTLAAVMLGTLTTFGTAMSSTARSEAPRTAIVVPARHAFLQLAVDVSRFHPVTVIGFRKSQTGPVRLFIWNESKKGWSRLSIEDYQSGAAFGGKATRLILVDADESIPPVLETLSPCVKEEQVINASSIGDLLNKFAPIFKFSESQFRSIAAWNNLTLTDHNADRRKYGRWGNPNGSTESEKVVPAEVHQGQQQAEAATEAMPVETVEAPSELPVAHVVSEQPETAVDPSSK
jgi:hypothetical protein